MNFIQIFLFVMAFGYSVAVIAVIIGLFTWALGSEESRERIRDSMGWTKKDSAQKSQRDQHVEIDLDYQRALRELNREFPGAIEGRS